MKNETAAISANMHGEKLYQQRAREALPILVRQAISHKTMYYQELADELKMPNPRNLNFILGSVGQSLIALGEAWREEIPPIQCLVINQSEELPGDGFGWFMTEADWKNLSKRQKDEMQRIFAYPKWPKVLEALGLECSTSDFSDLIRRASNRQGGGESKDHKVLKEYVQFHPELLRLGGLFQCVKYDAVLNGVSVPECRDIKVRAVLVLESYLPSRLLSMKHMLGVEVLEGVVQFS